MEELHAALVQEANNAMASMTVSNLDDHKVVTWQPDAAALPQRAVPHLQSQPALGSEVQAGQADTTPMALSASSDASAAASVDVPGVLATSWRQQPKSMALAERGVQWGMKVGKVSARHSSSSSHAHKR